MAKDFSHGVHTREFKDPSTTPAKTKGEELKRAKRKGIITPDCDEFKIKLEPMTSSTPVKGQYERALKEVLLEIGVSAAYEQLKFIIRGDDIYPPDFITSITVGGKSVVFETHNGNKLDYLIRMNIFRENYGNAFYLVLVSSNSLFAKMDINSRVTLDGDRSKLQVDERWKMPKIRVTGRGDSEIEDHEAWKQTVESLLIDLIARADKIGSGSTGVEFRKLMRAA